MSEPQPGNGNLQDHRDLRKNVAELWGAFREHVVEAKEDSTLLREHLKVKHMGVGDVEELMMKAKERGRSSVSKIREYAQTILAVAAVVTLIVTWLSSR